MGDLTECEWTMSDMNSFPCVSMLLYLNKIDIIVQVMKRMGARMIRGDSILQTQIYRDRALGHADA